MLQEHLLVGLKPIHGGLHRSADDHFVHTNMDTDVLLSEEPPPGQPARDLLRLCLPSWLNSFACLLELASVCCPRREPELLACWQGQLAWRVHCALSLPPHPAGLLGRGCRQHPQT